MPLTEQLIDLTALADLIFELTLFAVPIIGTVEMLGWLFVFKLHRLEEIAAVKEIVFCPLSAVFKQARIFVTFVPIPEKIRHFRGGFQCGQIHSLQPGGRPEKLHIKGVVLSALKYAVLVPVPFVGVMPAPGKFKDAFEAMGYMLYCDNMQQFEERAYNLFGEFDWKEFLQKEFNIDMEDL